MSLPKEDSCANPTAAIAFGWHRLRYEVSNGSASSKKVILRDLSGVIRFGQLTAVMGPSGAGKTTLMRCISGQAGTSAHMTPESQFFTTASSRSSLRSCFIEQHVQQSVVNSLTVRQLFRYAYRFQNGLSASDREVAESVDQIAAELALDRAVLDRRFGQCSGGEQRRIAIGQQLTNHRRPPALVAVDEPTTGLDSRSALLVVRVLSALAANHRRAIVASIHVPSAVTLAHFHQLYVMARGGVCVYRGPPAELRAHLERTLAIPIPPDQRPIETIVRVACEHWHDSKAVRKLTADNCVEGDKDGTTEDLDHIRSLPVGSLCNHRKRFCLSNLYTGLCRQFRISLLVECPLVFSQLVACAAVICFVASFFKSSMVELSGCYTPVMNASAVSGRDDAEPLGSTGNDYCPADYWPLAEHLNYLLLVGLFTGYISLCISALLWHSVSGHFRAEHRNNWYSLGCHYISVQTVATVRTLLLGVVSALTTYCVIGEHRIDDTSAFAPIRLACFLATTLLSLLHSAAIGALVSQLFRRLELCLLVAVFCYSVSVILNGFFLDADRIPVLVLWFAGELMATKYVTKAVVFTFYGLRRCASDGERSFVLQQHGINSDSVWFDLWRVIAAILVFQVVTFGVMYFRHSWDGPLMSLPRSLTVLLKRFGGCKKSFETSQMMAKSQEIIDVDQIDHHHHKEAAFLSSRVAIAWRHLSLLNPTESGRHILSDISGHFRFGTLSAIMGVSGAGKSSLLRLLNGQCHELIDHSHQQSELFVSAHVRLRSSFISQQATDHLFPRLTALQNVVYASRFKNLAHEQTTGTRLDHTNIAWRLLTELGIDGAAHTAVEQCSGGEQKRLALALELTPLEMPNLICFDEPISGLDSASAETVMTCLHRLTRHHPLALVTIVHQPSTTIVATFDQIYLLARGGVCLFSGPPSNMADRLAAVPECQESVANESPLDTLVDYSCSTPTEDPVVYRLVELEREQQQQTELLWELCDDIQPLPDGISLTETIGNSARFRFGSIRILASRQWAYFRAYQWIEHVVLFVAAMVYMWVMQHSFQLEYFRHESGCVHLLADFSSADGACALVSVIDRVQANTKYLVIVFPVFALCVTIHTVYGVFREMALLCNEHRNGWYSAGAYYVMRTTADLVPVVPTLAVYLYVVQLDPRPPYYAHHLLVMCVYLWGLQALGNLNVFLSNGRAVRAALGLVCLAIALVSLSNTFVALPEQNAMYRAVAALSPPRHVVDLLLMLQYGFGRCGDREVSLRLYHVGLETDAALRNDYPASLAALVVVGFGIHVVALYTLVRVLAVPKPGGNIRNQKQKKKNVEVVASEGNKKVGV